MKGNARKVRRLHDGKVLAGFAGGTADAFTLFEHFEAKLEKHGNLTRAAVELAKDWRTDRMLRRLEAMLASPTGRLAADLRHRRRDRARARADRDRLRRRVRAGRGARAAREHRARRARDRREGARTSPATSASTRTASSRSKSSDADVDDAARDRRRARQAHRRPARRQARGRDRAAQPLAARAGRRAAARRDHAEEHPDDRPDRRRQDRDRAPAREARERAVHQGRGDEVHRGRLRRPRRRLDHARPGRHGGEDDARGTR